MHATLDDLPPEILLPIIAYTLYGESVPSNILCVNHQFRNAGVEWLYRNLRFHSPEQLKLFAQTGENAGVVPRSVTVDLTGKYARADVWQYLREALCRCYKPGLGQKQVLLEILCLKLHSYSQDTSHHLFEEALSVANPRIFRWTGPDPDHHFSTAIVAPVARRLCRIFGTWSNIQDITVTNIAFSSEFLGVDESATPLLPEIPGLRTLYVGQATFLSAGSVAALFCVNRMASLERVRLVDAYCESIWGSRIRRSDIEKAAQTIMFPQLRDVVQYEGVLSRIQNLLTCEKKTERIVGGDRVEGSIFLV